MTILPGMERLPQVQREKEARRARPQSPWRGHSPGHSYSQPPEAGPPAQGYKTGPDLRRCPKDYDPEIWRLTLAFMDQAEKYGVELEVSSYRTYAMLRDRIGKAKGRKALRDRENWIEIVELMIAEFWENEIKVSDEAWSISQFCGVETFTGLAGWAIRQLAPEPDWHEQAPPALSERGQAARAAIRAREERATAYAEMSDEDRRAQASAKAAALREKWGSE